MGIDYPDVRLGGALSDASKHRVLLSRDGTGGSRWQTLTVPNALLKEGQRTSIVFHSTIRCGPRHYSQALGWLECDHSVYGGGECRHSGILTYFKDSDRIDGCGHCDVCAPDQGIALNPAYAVKAATLQNELVSELPRPQL